MRFIKRKNLQEGEDLLYIPLLHWMYIIEPLLKRLIILAALLSPGYFIGFRGLLGNGIALIAQTVTRYMFLAAIIYLLFFFVWRIILYWHTEYGITNKRLIIKRGVSRTVVTEIPFDRIESITCTQGILGMIFHYGTIRITGIGGSEPVFYIVRKPYAVRRKIAAIIEKNKTITVIYGDLPKPKPVVKPEPVPEEEPVYRYGTFVRVLDT